MRTKTNRYGEKIFILVVLSVTFVYYAVIFWGPLFFEVYLSLSRWNLFGSPVFKGLYNYIDMWSDPLFWNGLSLAFQFTAFYVCVGIPLQLGLALGLNGLRRKRLSKVLLGLCFVPVISSTVAMALVWRLLYAPQYGQINAVLGILGLPTQSFLRDVSQALFSIAGVGVWKVAGLGIVIFLAGLREVPEVLYEAARIDGASLWASFRYITMPLLKRVLTFQLVMTILWGMQTFALVYVMIPGTPGGPGHATNTIVLYIYKVGIRGLNLGHAASMGIVLFLILFVLAAIQLKLLSTKWEY